MFGAERTDAVPRFAGSHCLAPPSERSRPVIHPALAAERRAVLALFNAASTRLAELMPKIESDADIEALHQLRVELRRTRSALQALNGALPVPDAAVLVGECRWLAGRGSGMRDLDVLRERLGDYLGGAPDHIDPALHRLLREVARLRGRERRAMLDAFLSRRGHRLVARLEELGDLPPHGYGWSGEAALAAAVRRALRKLRRHARPLGVDSPAQAWHDLRKRAKRTRYLLDLYAGVDDSKQLRETNRLARRLQSALGDHQDFHTHAALFEELLRSPAAANDPAYERLLRRLVVELRARIPRALDRARSRLAEFLFSRERKCLEARLAPERFAQHPAVGSNGYCHGYADGAICGLPAGKMVCAGVSHAAQTDGLRAAAPARAPLLIKPPSAAIDIVPSLHVPTDRGRVQYAIAIAVLIGRELRNATPEQARAAVAGVGLALQLTLRDLKDELILQGQPWEIATGFDGSCALSHFVQLDPGPDPGALELRLVVNGRRQSTGSARMPMPLIELICLASTHFSLWPGDVLLAGTPVGENFLVPGDRFLAQIGDIVSVRSVVTG